MPPLLGRQAPGFASKRAIMRLKERTTAGFAAARVQGRNGGRPTVMDAGKLAAAKARRERGESPAAIARALGCLPGQRVPAPRRRRGSSGGLIAA
jgi:hypothetical protein